MSADAHIATAEAAEIVAFCATCGHTYAAGDALHAHTEEN